MRVFVSASGHQYVAILELCLFCLLFYKCIYNNLFCLCCTQQKTPKIGAVNLVADSTF